MATNLPKVAIIGAGGLGRDLLDVFDAVNTQSPMYDVMGFIVETAFGKPGEIINGKPILGDLGWFAGRQAEVAAICGIGAPEVRRRLVLCAQGLGVRFCSVIHPAAVMSRWVSIGSGVVITAGCVLTNHIRIGDHVVVNLACTIGHDVVLEDYATISPGAHISGNVAVGEGAFIGTGANIIEKLAIGRWSVVGAGSAVVREVRPNVTVFGVPAREIREREDGWHLR